ncbi:energy-coupling factor ABC transporter ATP-binding protein [Cohnella luojiensis]|uniref:ABC transporter ATP-binding protein n=1 Tax=Cohnella luojiensis TaxID=652876 RepID=A0A4Y8LNM3_9BACL|nr:ABC transporter ATP-binding protein [Cohnella luojiensis]TFE19798.1 ABC transporter ATP-binding protein [Cohnella luojiensis]
MELQSIEPMVLKEVFVYGMNALDEPSLRLDSVSLTLAAAEWLTVVGVNGSGKSTLARLLAGLEPEGRHGEVNRGFAGDRSCPIVLQQPKSQLFGETPREEISFALEWRGVSSDQISFFVDRALYKTGLTEVADEPWERLSGGQQQLAAIAAATASDTTSLLVLDEATSMLDEENRNAVKRVVRDLYKKGTAVVWVTQRLDELDPDSRVLAIGEGRVIFDGEVREFLYGVSGETADELSSLSPCLRAGLRLPYLPAMALNLRRQGKLDDPLPVTAQEWRKVMGNFGVEANERAAR